MRWPQEQSFGLYLSKMTYHFHNHFAVYIYVNQISALYTLNAHNDICQLYLSKAGGENDLWCLNSETSFLTTPAFPLYFCSQLLKRSSSISRLPDFKHYLFSQITTSLLALPLLTGPSFHPRILCPLELVHFQPCWLLVLDN